jgi:glutamate-ammonia-ligase adenylyltransferase
MSSAVIDNLTSETFRKAATKVLELSPFFAELTQQEPALAEQAISSADASFDERSLKQRYAAFVDEFDGELNLSLRKLRQREMIRIVFRDLNRIADLEETTAELSHLADYCVEKALTHCYEDACEKYGVPLKPSGEPERLIVLAMGKLGAYELNLSSDIDMIFLYTHPGQIDLNTGKTLSHQEFFLRLARQVIACLDDAGAIDNVFRVDMRLRPYGESGPLVLHRAAMEKYYLEQGRDWERYAFIKARVSAGDIEAGEEFLRWMKPFVFRKYLDYSAVQSLREMKGLIARQVELKEMNHDLKLGPGGIREVEFIAQAHQLIWGGRYPELQERRLMVALGTLSEMEFLPHDDAKALQDAYVFLRNSEHVIQAEYDRQTHSLPEEEESRQRLAKAMGFGGYEDYLTVLDQHRDRVTGCFEKLVSSRGEQDREVDPTWISLWQSAEDEALAALKEDIESMSLDTAVLEVIDELMPRILMLIPETELPDLALPRVLPIVRAVLRRSTYLVFLNENPDALKRVIHLAELSPWIAEQLSAYPILLYELTDRSVREVAVTKIALEGELREVMRAVDAGDLESQMDTLRQFKLAATLKIAAMELLDELSIMQASDGLTALAEVILETSVELASSHLEARHGLPCDSEGQLLNQRFAIIAYGKAGGLELAYGSDLDLVFLCPNDISGNTDGKAAINNNVFFVRLGQRVIHILTSFTRFGTLYSADLRLRPQGNKGPLVATLNAFERYQNDEAWTWEHQALVRARFVAGDVAVGEVFKKIRQSVLEQKRDRAKLLEDVIMMREKMREHLASPTNAKSEDGMEILAEFDLKHDAGAIVDIEFMVQYAVLGWASKWQELSRWTDVMRLLDELSASKVFSEQEVEALQRAYLAFRAAVHHGWLGLETDYERLQTYRTDVAAIWNKRMAG